MTKSAGNNGTGPTRFHRATKQRRRLRLALMGPSGSGKTYTALKLATEMGAKFIGLVDTERSSSELYAEYFDFVVAPLTNFHPKHYMAAVDAAAAEGVDVLIIDSLSHAWIGEGGILDQKDSKNGFDAWRTLTPMHNALVNKILDYPGHVIITLRSKTAYEVEKDDKGKTSVKKLGLAAEQRSGMEYEFDVVLLLDQENTADVTKTRCHDIKDEQFRKPGKDLAQRLVRWLESDQDRTVERVKSAVTAIEKLVGELLKRGDVDAPARWTKSLEALGLGVVEPEAVDRVARERLLDELTAEYKAVKDRLRELYKAQGKPAPTAAPEGEETSE